MWIQKELCNYVTWGEEQENCDLWKWVTMCVRKN